jgi:hypothetical protein
VLVLASLSHCQSLGNLERSSAYASTPRSLGLLPDAPCLWAWRLVSSLDAPSRGAYCSNPLDAVNVGKAPSSRLPNLERQGMKWHKLSLDDGGAARRQVVAVAGCQWEARLLGTATGLGASCSAAGCLPQAAPPPPPCRSGMACTATLALTWRTNLRYPECYNFVLATSRLQNFQFWKPHPRPSQRSTS